MILKTRCKDGNLFNQIDKLKKLRDTTIRLKVHKEEEDKKKLINVQEQQQQAEDNEDTI